MKKIKAKQSFGRSRTEDKKSNAENVLQVRRDGITAR